jgi:predicted phosphodiesterase
VVSDLHLGARGGRAVLGRPELRAALLEAIAQCDRLVLLGDVIEFRQGRRRDALAAASGVLDEFGAALGPGRRVVIVPGNHDHQLVLPAFERRSRSGPPRALDLQSGIGWQAEEPLAVLAQALAPAEVQAVYPGVWLRPDVYATHGHYGDRHTTVPMLERVGAGLTARAVREPPAGPRAIEDYEAALAPMYAWIDAIAQLRAADLGAGSDGASAKAWRAIASKGRRGGVRARAIALGFPALIAALSRTPIGPLRADLSGVELRRAGLRAFGESLSRLEVAAAHVIFGHTHRAGPLPSDDQSEWRAPGGAKLINTGCWVHEPHFLGRSPGQSPYRSGFAAWVGDGGPPELVNLLDGRR